MGEREEVERERLVSVPLTDVAQLVRALRIGSSLWPADMSVNEYEAPYIASAVLASDWLRAHDERIRADERERLADVWDEAAEATADWMANNPGPSGIPHDPPSNPYDQPVETSRP